MRQSQAFRLSYWSKYLRRRLPSLGLVRRYLDQYEIKSLSAPLGWDQPAQRIANPKTDMGKLVNIQYLVGATDLGPQYPWEQA